MLLAIVKGGFGRHVWDTSMLQAISPYYAWVCRTTQSPEILRKNKLMYFLACLHSDLVFRLDATTGQTNISHLLPPSLRNLDMVSDLLLGGNSLYICCLFQFFRCSDDYANTPSRRIVATNATVTSRGGIPATFVPSNYSDQFRARLIHLHSSNRCCLKAPFISPS